MSYPLAYYLAKIVSPASLPTLILLLFIPLWVSEALRAFAWYIILTLNGPLNAILVGVGLMDKPIRWQNGVVTPYDAIMIGLIYTYVLFMLFPIYGSIQSLDRNQIEAAEDLGRQMVADALARDPAARQARHRLGLRDGFHARGRFAAGAIGAAVDQVELVHPDDPGPDAGKPGLERRRGLFLPLHPALHGRRDARHVAVQGQAQRHREIGRTDDALDATCSATSISGPSCSTSSCR